MESAAGVERSSTVANGSTRRGGCSAMPSRFMPPLLVSATGERARSMQDEVRAPAPQDSFRAILAALLLLAVGVGRAAGQGPRNLLTGGLSEQALAAALIPSAQWRPYPTIQDRADWEAVPQEIRAGFIRRAEQYLNTTWERIPATVALQYIRNGNRSNYDATNTRQREKLTTLVLAEVFENEGRF